MHANRPAHPRASRSLLGISLLAVITVAAAAQNRAVVGEGALDPPGFLPSPLLHPAPPRDSTLTRQDREDIFEKTWRDIRDLYYDPTFHGVNWDQIHEQFLPDVRAAKDDEDFYAVVRRMTGELHDAHTRFYSPEQWKRIKQHERAGLGFTAAEVEGKTVITAVEPDSGAQRTGILPGMIVLSVDGKPVAERLAEAAAKREPSSSERADQLFVYRDVFSAPIGSAVKLGLARFDGSAFESTLTAQIFPNVPSVETRLLPPARPISNSTASITR